MIPLLVLVPIVVLLVIVVYFSYGVCRIPEDLWSPCKTRSLNVSEFIVGGNWYIYIYTRRSQ